MCCCCFSIIAAFCTLVHHECTIFSAVLIGIALSKVQFVRTNLITYSVHKFNIGFHNSDLERSIWSHQIVLEGPNRKEASYYIGIPIAKFILITAPTPHSSANNPIIHNTKTNESGFHNTCSVMNCLGVGLLELFYRRAFVTGLRGAV